MVQYPGSKENKSNRRKKVRIELTDIIKKPGSLNNALEQAHDEATRNRTLVARGRISIQIPKLVQKGS